MFIERTKCIFCDNILHNVMFDINKNIYISSNFIDTIENYITIPYNIYVCDICLCYQNKYLGDLSLVYNSNHNNVILSDIWIHHYQLFYTFIINNYNNINKEINILEIGAGNNYIVNLFINDEYKNYTILEPNITNKLDNINYISEFLENFKNNINYDITILSHVFEHLYNPKDLFNINSKYIVISVPNIHSYLDNFIVNFLNIEHTFYFEEYHIIYLFGKFNYKLIKKEYYDKHSIFMFFEKINTYGLDYNFIKNNLNNNIKIKINNHFNKILSLVDNINNYINNNENINFALFPAHFYITYFMIFGLDISKIKYLYDNNINKKNKYLYGTNLICKNLDYFINKNYCILLLGFLYNTEIIELLNENNINYKKL